MTQPSEEFWRRVVATAHSLDRHSYYDVLGIRADAPGDAVREAYYRMVKRVHPDRYARERGAERKQALVKLYARVGEAYRTLSDPKLRERYDQGLDEGQTRLAPDAKPVGRPLVDQRDPKTPQGRQLYDRGMALLAAGDRKAARAQLQLAAQFEPDSSAIAAALADTKDPPSSAPVAPPAPVPAAAPPAPAAEPSDARPPSEPAEPPRAHPRHAIVRPVTVRCRTWAQVETVYTKNISAGGMFLKTGQPPEMGTPLELQLKLPDERVITLRGCVVHVILPDDPQGRSAGVGVEFRDTDAHALAEIEALLAARGEREPPPPDPEVMRVANELLELAARIRQSTPAAALGIPDGAPPGDVRRAYVNMARRYHPDQYGRYASVEITAAADEVSFLVRRAYDKLRGGT